MSTRCSSARGSSGITAIRLEALPDDRLPSRGPGRVYYEGPFGDFYLSEIQLSADGKPVPIKDATASNPKARKDAAAAIDGDPQTGWSINGGQGREQSAVFRLAGTARATRARSPSRWSSSAITRPASADSGSRRRPTRRAVTAREIPFELEPILLMAERRAEARAEWIGCATTT